ncbi:hypothetical protein ACFL5Z_12895 [Planctomycetota bacterium]
MLVNKFRGTVADRPIDSRVIQNESTVREPTTAQGIVPYYSNSMRHSNARGGGLMERIRQALDFVNSYEPEYQVGKVPIYEKG